MLNDDSRLDMSDMPSGPYTFEEYHEHASQTAIYRNRGNNINYPALGLFSEAGEIAGKLKKMDRDNNGEMNTVYRTAIIQEIGDALWYLDQLCFELDTTLAYAALMNIAKLQDRKERGKLAGEGDDR